MRITVIGGGIIGLATALRLIQKLPAVSITMLEKEAGVGQHQSGHNSGVLHCGLYYKPGSMKAKLAVTGIRQMIAFCQEHGIPHEVCGKLVVAAKAEEVPRLNDLFERGQQNGLNGLRKLGSAEMREIEPHVGGVAAIRVPEEGIADYPAVCKTLVRCLAAAGGKVVTQAAVTRLQRIGAQWIAETGAGDFESDYIVNCAGLQCDRVCSLAGDQPELKIIPFRGEYYKLKPERQYLVRNLIYPVPDPRFPFLGVHFTRLDSRRHRSRSERGAGVRARRIQEDRFFGARFHRHADLSRILALFSEVPADMLRRIAPLVQQRVILQVAQRLGTRGSSRGFGAGRRGRSGASHRAKWRDAAGFSFCPKRPRVACFKRSQPGRHGIAGHRAGNRKPAHLRHVIVNTMLRPVLF